MMGNKVMAEDSVPLCAPVLISATEDSYTIRLPADSIKDLVITFSAGSEVNLSQDVAAGTEFPLSFNPPDDIAQNGLAFSFDSVGSMYFPANGKIKVNGTIVTPAGHKRKIK